MKIFTNAFQGFKLNSKSIITIRFISNGVANETGPGLFVGLFLFLFAFRG